jgi:dienelactone hydrolase
MIFRKVPLSWHWWFFIPSERVHFFPKLRNLNSGKEEHMKKIIIYTFALAASVFVPLIGSAQQVPSVPFAQRQVKLENGIIGKPLTFESASPRDFEEVIGRKALRLVRLDGQLFIPAGAELHSVVIIVPGSGGVVPPTLMDAQELTSVGLAVYVLDPFAGRGIKDTIFDQTQLSQAASPYDVLAAARMLATQPGIDGQRIGAMGYSRGGSAVLLAASQQMTRAVLGEGISLKAVLAAWPYCGHQFEHAITAPTAVRFLVGDSDNQVSPVQCQGEAAAMRANNAQVSIRFFKGAHHGFGSYGPPKEVPNAVKSRNCPINYINDQGLLLDLYTGLPVPAADTAAYTKSLNCNERGTMTIGTKPGLPEAFVDDMIGFFKVQLKP